MNTLKKLLPFIAIIVLILIIKGNISAIIETKNNAKQVENLRNQLTIEEKKNKYLKERLSYVQTNKFVKEEAEKKLGMLGQGEYFVIAPTPQPNSASNLVLTNKPNWQKWIDLFF